MLVREWYLTINWSHDIITLTSFESTLFSFLSNLNFDFLFMVTCLALLAYNHVTASFKEVDHDDNYVGVQILLMI